jgi:glycosyltransferase involved in cell wall biosynthesis
LLVTRIKKARIALICDYLEEGWPSMDLVADALWQKLEARYQDRFEVSQLRPRFVKRLSQLRFRDWNGAASIADRLMNRFLDYPRYLKIRKREFDLFHVVDHSYSHLVQVLEPRYTLVTCHDLDAFRCMRETQSGIRSRLLRRITQSVVAGLRNAAAVACDSRATRDQVLQHRLVPRERLSVNHNGFAQCFTRTPDPGADAAAARLLGKTERVEILHVGSTIARKRIDVVLRSFAAVTRQVPSARLIRVGGAFNARQRGLMKELSLASDSVAVLPFLKSEVLAAVYRRASVVVLPSESEGFGLPALEAMACGTPVVLSDLPALREVAGEAAIFRPVGDYHAWSHAISELISERETRPQILAERCAAGFEWAAQFTWDAYAQRAASLYRELLTTSQ